MSILSWEKNESVAVIKMSNGENRMNQVFTDTMIAIMDEIAADTSISSVMILSGDGKFWSTGLDVQWALGLAQAGNMAAIRTFMESINEMFKKILLFPMPVIAVINGHAFGAGAIFSCVCDFRFMKADRGYFCFPEVDIGIPFLPSEIAFITRYVPHRLFQEMVFSGKRYGAADLEGHGIIEKACADEADLMARSLAFAKSYKKKRGIFGEMKRRLNNRIIEIMDNEDAKYVNTGTMLILD
ncbi:MAG: enoyl-CoA hydratase/isomerase family protein [Spirochaetes bacterium]|nr:enoyl-CoA hydratase/isomerase family protein [Spirochaetota bacterium]